MSVGLIQRVCAGYRVPLFDMLADTLPGGLSPVRQLRIPSAMSISRTRASRSNIALL